MPPRRPSLTVLDALQFSERGAGCIFFLRSEKTALIESGTAASAPLLLDALRGIHIDYIFVTHVHLDHAGGAGHVAMAHPEARVVVHPRGLLHLADPERLVAGVRTASPDLFSLYGEPQPVEPRRLVACADGATFLLGRGCHLMALETPGHAPHHVSFFAPEMGVLFVGDAAGHHGALADVPLTVPPRFDRAASRESVRKMRDLSPSRLAFTHFGLADRAPELLDAYPHKVDEWLERIAALRREVSDIALADAVLADPRYRALSGVAQSAVRMCARGAVLTLDRETATTAEGA